MRYLGLLRTSSSLLPVSPRRCSSSVARENGPSRAPPPPAETGETEPAQEKDCVFSRIDIELRAHQPEVLSSYNWFATTAARYLNVPISAAWADLEPHILRKTLLRSAFVHSKHRVQYEFRTYMSYINVGTLTGSTASTYLEYIQRNLPEGVAMKVTKHERKPFAKPLNST